MQATTRPSTFLLFISVHCALSGGALGLNFRPVRQITDHITLEARFPSDHYD